MILIGWWIFSVIPLWAAIFLSSMLSFRIVRTKLHKDLLVYFAILTAVEIILGVSLKPTLSILGLVMGGFLISLIILTTMGTLMLKSLFK